MLLIKAYEKGIDGMGKRNRRSHEAREGRQNPTLVAMLKAVTIALLATTAVLLLFSFAMSKKDLPLSLLNPFSALMLALSCFVAGYLAARKLRARGLAVGAGCGLVIFLLLLLASVQNEFAVGMTAAVKLVIALCSGAIGGILGVNAKSRRK